MIDERPTIKIAIFSPNRPFFGTTMTQLPLLYALKQKYPNAQIDVWSKSGISHLLKEAGVADCIVDFSGLGIYKLTKKLKKNNYQVIYNLHPSSLRIHLAIKLSGASQCYGLIASNWHKCFYDVSIIDDKDAQYIAYRFLNLFNLAEGENINPNIIINLVATSNINVTNKDLTVIPGGGAGEYKRWGIENYCEAVKILLDDKVTKGKVNFILGPDEANYTKTIREILNSYQVQIHQSLSVKELIHIATQSQLTLANDCGPAHIFQMVESPIIMMLGWNDHGSSPYKVLSEWYNCHEHSWAIFPNENNKRIQSISLEKVICLAKSELMRDLPKTNANLNVDLSEVSHDAIN